MFVMNVKEKKDIPKRRVSQRHGQMYRTFSNTAVSLDQEFQHFGSDLEVNFKELFTALSSSLLPKKLELKLYTELFCCTIHLWFRLMGGLQAKSMTSQRTPNRQKMADMCYYGNIMTTTRWWLCVTMETFSTSSTVQS